MNIKNNLLGFFKGFGYAFTGIISCLKTERNMRFHFGIAFYVIVFMLEFYNLTTAETIAVIMCIGGVIGLECINTALESLCDYACKSEKSVLIKKAKDAAAGAVLIAAITSVFVAYKIFFDMDKFTMIFNYYTQHIMEFIILIISLILWILWVLSADNNKNKDKEKI